MDVLNWREVASGLYSAGQPSPAQWPKIRKAGVGTVLNLRPDDEQPGVDEARLVADAGMRYRQLPVPSGDSLDPACVDRFSALLAERGHDGLLVHCASGNRVGALLALHARRHAGASIADALELGRRAGLAGLETKVRDLLESMQ